VEGGGGGADKGNLNLGLVLQEVRRRADSDTLARHTQDIFKAVHNVQKRLLEEHVSAQLQVPLQRWNLLRLSAAVIDFPQFVRRSRLLIIFPWLGLGEGGGSEL
jgi:hypothetical protein